MPVTINGNGTISGLVVTTAELQDASVTTAKIAADAVTTVDIANGAVTLPKMADMATASVLGRNTAGTGAPEVLDASTARSVIGANNASNLTTGTVATARLATGTANSTTYLRGDQTWATVTGGVTSITAGSGLTGGTITSSGTIALDYYTGSDANNTSFPIGSYVCVDVASAATTARNSTATVRLSSDGGAFIVGGSLSVLAGTWRARGKSGFAISGCTVYVFLLYQRTA